MTISLIRTLLLYVMIIAAVRIMGKRQISELQTSELVVTLLISDIAAIPMQNTGQPLSSGIIPILVLVSCEIAASFFMVKNSRFRKLVAGKPQVVINNGTVDQAQMKRLRMSTEDLSEQLRQMNVFSIQDVAYAIVETNGKLSVDEKAGKGSGIRLHAGNRGSRPWDRRCSHQRRRAVQVFFGALPSHRGMGYGSAERPKSPFGGCLYYDR